MDDNVKNASSYQLDQEILDARGIDMTVSEVAGLSTCKYAERVQSLKLKEDDLAFLKGLRRRIKNRLASQNSRRRSVEHLRRLTRELRAVRACRDDALQERRTLVTQRDACRKRCVALRHYIVQKLQERSDTTNVPCIDVKRVTESHNLRPIDTTIEKPLVKTEKSHTTPKQTNTKYPDTIENTEKEIFECRIDKLVQKSVNHIFKCKGDEKKKTVYAKTVFIANDKLSSEIGTMVLNGDVELKGILGEADGVLNLSLKEGRRKSHGRKQLAPRRIACVYGDNDDGVLDLKIKKEGQ